MCTSSDFKIISSISTTETCGTFLTDAESEFLETGSADCDVHIKPPVKSSMQNLLWLLQTAAYGVVNSKAERQYQSHKSFISSGTQHILLGSKLFSRFKNRAEKLVAIKHFNYILRSK